MSQYAQDVKAAVAELLGLASSGRYHTLSLDTDEDCPFVDLWYRGKSVRACGWYRDEWLSPPEGSDDNWSFLDCCNHVLAAARELMPPTEG